MLLGLGFEAADTHFQIGRFDGAQQGAGAGGEGAGTGGVDLAGAEFADGGGQQVAHGGCGGRDGDGRNERVGRRRCLPCAAARGWGGRIRRFGHTSLDGWDNDEIMVFL